MALGESQTVPGTRFHGAVPILRVRHLQASLHHYQKILRFSLDWRHLDIMASVSRDGASIMLCEGDQGNPHTWVWIGVGDAGALHQEYARTGATIRLPPTNYSWAYEMHVEDPDGHVLRLGSEPRSNEPFSDWVMWYGEEPGPG